MRGKDPIETIMDLLLEDRSRIGTIYFLMSEDNIKKQIRQPWVSFGSDAASIAAEGVFLKSSAHPRTYGNFARLLGKYVRDEKVISLTEAIRRLTSLPATNLGLQDRGSLKPGCLLTSLFSIPKPSPTARPSSSRINTRSVSETFFVNGVHVLKNGEHTGAKPGRALWGPGKIGGQLSGRKSKNQTKGFFPKRMPSLCFWQPVDFTCVQ
jgi:N-acyl-D-amino-acid deacylase